MSEKGEYFMLNIDYIFSEVTKSSSCFALRGVEHSLVFNLIPSKLYSDDLFEINLKPVPGYSSPCYMNFDVTTFVSYGNGDVHFVQHAYVEYSGIIWQNTVWKMDKHKFVKEYEAAVKSLSTSKAVTFVCVFGPLGAYLKDTIRIKDIPVCKTIQPNPNSDSHTQSNPNTGSHESLFADLTKLLESESLSDVVLKCDDLSFPAHKIILSARSSVFSAMFQHDMSENRDGLVNIKDIDATTFGQFLRYVYSGQLPVFTEDSAPLFYKAGDKYAVDALKEGCATYMVGNLKEENACDLLVLADSHADEEFKASVMSFIKINDNSVLKHESWRKFRRDHPTLAFEVYDTCNE